MFEEIRLEGEGIKPTVHEKIHVFDGGKPSFDQVGGWLEELAVLVDRRNMHGLITKLKEIVPEYTPSPEILSMCEEDRFTGYRKDRAGLGAE